VSLVVGLANGPAKILGGTADRAHVSSVLRAPCVMAAVSLPQELAVEESSDHGSHRVIVLAQPSLELQPSAPGRSRSGKRTGRPTLRQLLLRPSPSSSPGWVQASDFAQWQPAEPWQPDCTTQTARIWQAPECN
jgi:hypothetical protein